MRVAAGKVTFALAVWLGLALLAVSAYALPGACTKLTIEGEAQAGHEWSEPMGGGWVFRVVPVQPAEKYSGWDLVVDREQPVGFPDALYLATPPYGSLNEREIGTSYGLRAQDAIGWNPRSFRFLTDPAALRAAQKAYSTIPKEPQPSHMGLSSPDEATIHLLSLISPASSGEFRIVDARVVPGVADAAAYAQNWALAASRTQHEVLPSPQPGGTPRGSLAWMRFSVTLWLPAGWHAPPQWARSSGPCP